MLFEPYVSFLVLVQLGWLSGRLLGNSCLLGLRYVFLVYVPECHFSFSSSLGYLSDFAISRSLPTCTVSSYFYRY